METPSNTYTNTNANTLIQTKHKHPNTNTQTQHLKSTNTQIHTSTLPYSHYIHTKSQHTIVPTVPTHKCKGAPLPPLHLTQAAQPPPQSGHRVNTRPRKAPHSSNDGDRDLNYYSLLLPHPVVVNFAAIQIKSVLKKKKERKKLKPSPSLSQ